jgi:hypothetical protein
MLNAKGGSVGEGVGVSDDSGVNEADADGVTAAPPPEQPVNATKTVIMQNTIASIFFISYSPFDFLPSDI